MCEHRQNRSIYVSSSIGSSVHPFQSNILQAFFERESRTYKSRNQYRRIQKRTETQHCWQFRLWSRQVVVNKPSFCCLLVMFVVSFALFYLCQAWFIWWTWLAAISGFMDRLTDWFKCILHFYNLESWQKFNSITRECRTDSKKYFPKKHTHWHILSNYCREFNLNKFQIRSKFEITIIPML